MRRETKKLFSMRLEPSRKEKWERAAEASGENLSNWIRIACENMARRPTRTVPKKGVA